MKWTQEHTARGWAWRKGATTVLRMENGDRPWFASRGMMMLADNRRNVRRFGSAQAAMRAADAAAPTAFCA